MGSSAPSDDPAAGQVRPVGPRRDVAGQRRAPSPVLAATEQLAAEQMEPDGGRHRVAGEPEHDLVAAAAEPDRAAGVGHHPPEDLLDADARERGADVVVAAAADAAGRDHQPRAVVALVEKALEGQDRLVHVVAHGQRRDGPRARRRGLGREPDPAGVPHRPGAESRAQGEELPARRQQREPGAATAAHRRVPRRAEGDDLVGRHPGAGLQQHGVAHHHLPAPAHVVAGRDGRHPDAAVLLPGELDGHDRVGALGERGAGRDPRRLAGAQRRRERRPGRALAADPQRPGRVGRPDGVAVHR